MFDKSYETKKREEEKIFQEYIRSLKSGMYSGWDIGYNCPETVHFRGVDYDVEPAWKLVVDGYDDLISSVELSHRQGLGFSIIKSYHGTPEKLDFRFARVQDNIEIKQKENIKDVYLNSVNIRYTFIEGSNKCNYDITINSDIIDFAISLKWFIRNNKDTIESINFQGVDNKLMAILIGRICAEGGINKIAFIDEESADVKKESEDNNKYTNKML